MPGPRLLRKKRGRGIPILAENHIRNAPPACNKSGGRQAPGPEMTGAVLTRAWWRHNSPRPRKQDSARYSCPAGDRLVGAASAVFMGILS